MPRERELKLALSESEAARLEALLGPPLGVILQENHYLDTREGLLARVPCGLRLREERGIGWKLALKGPARASGLAALADREEQERSVTEAEARAILERGVRLEGLGLPLPEALRGLPPATRCVVWGSLANERRLLAGPIEAGRGAREAEGPEAAELRELRGRGEISVALDCSRFPGGTREFELEVEFAEFAEGAELTEFTEGAEGEIARVEAGLRSLFAREGIAWSPQRRSKLARMRAARDAGR